MQRDESGEGVNPIEAASADPATVLWTDAAQEIFKRNVPFLNEVLRQLLTASIALAGGGILFLSDAACQRGFKVTAGALFLLGILSALAGVLPYRDDVCPFEVRAVQDSLRRVIAWKSGWIWAASVFVVLGLVVAFVGVLLK